MSESFSADWLSLRETADALARSPILLALAKTHFGAKKMINIMDLGTGTGSNYRYLKAHLPIPQQWWLVDRDPKLLGVLRETLPENAPVHLVACDLNALSTLDFSSLDLVTASALLDLTTAAWVDALVTKCREAHCALWVTLSVNGVIQWQPPHPNDDAIRDAFNRHQLNDKGFGHALGPRGGDYLATCLALAGYEVVKATANWRLEGVMQRALVDRLIVDYAAVAREMGVAAVDDWQSQRNSWRDQTQLRVGHWDILALPHETTIE